MFTTNFIFRCIKYEYEMIYLGKNIYEIILYSQNEKYYDDNYISQFYFQRNVKWKTREDLCENIVFE